MNKITITILVLVIIMMIGVAISTYYITKLVEINKRMLTKVNKNNRKDVLYRAIIDDISKDFAKKIMALESTFIDRIDEIECSILNKIEKKAKEEVKPSYNNSIEIMKKDNEEFESAVKDGTIKTFFDDVKETDEYKNDPIISNI